MDKKNPRKDSTDNPEKNAKHHTGKIEAKSEEGS